MTDSIPGWQPDPTGRHEHRYWDGSKWTDDVADAGEASTDAYDPGEAAATDPTTAGPVTPGDPTAEWPPAPAPPVASGSPVEEPGSAGPKKGLLIGGGILAAVVVAVVAFLLLGGDDDDAEDIEARIASEIRSDGSVSDEQARCMAAHIVDEIGADRLADVDFSAEEPPPELADEFVAASSGAFAECGGFPDVDEDDDPVVDDEEPAGDDGSDLGDVEFDAEAEAEAMLADIYEQSLGLDREQAECLAGRIAEAIDSGSLTEDQAMSEIFSYLSDCDISLEEIGAN